MKKTHKNTIIFFTPFSFKKFDFDRYEINNLKKKFHIEIHDFNKLLYPHFNSAFKKNYVISNEIKKFDSLKKWKKYMSFKKKIADKNFFIINFLSQDSLNVFRILSFVKKIKIKRIDVLNFGLPKYEHEKQTISLISHYKSKLKQFFLRFNVVKYNLKSILIEYIFFKIFAKFLNIKPEFLLVAGNKYLNNLDPSINCIKGNSWDYSRYLRSLKFSTKKIKKSNYIVFLSNSGPKYPSDSNFYKTKTSETIKNWYNNLKFFFDNLEDTLGLKVIISSHPKAKFEKRITYLGNRRAYFNKTMSLVKNCKFVITQNSTSISYATIFKKPIIFIYTNETKNNPSLFKYSKFLCKILDGHRINLDNYSQNDLNFSFKNLKKKYNQFINNYLTCRSDKKANYEIITSLIEKLN